MFRAKKTQLQLWDDEIENYLDRISEARLNADRAEDWARTCYQFRVTRRLAGPLLNWAAKQRDDAATWQADMDEMLADPDNPRNGGKGWDPAPTFWEVVSVWDVAVVVFRLLCHTALMILVIGGLLSIALRHDPHLWNSPHYYLTVLEIAGAWLWSGIIASRAVYGAIDLTSWYRDQVRTWAGLVFGGRS